MQELLNKFDTYRKLGNRLEELYAEYPENEILEKRFNRVYKKEWETAELIADKIVEISKGQIQKNIARKMLYSQFTKLKALLV